jgi:hypothetical protein
MFLSKCPDQVGYAEEKLPPCSGKNLWDFLGIFWGFSGDGKEAG